MTFDEWLEQEHPYHSVCDHDSQDDYRQWIHLQLVAFDAGLISQAARIAELEVAAWREIEAFTVLEDSFQIAARRNLETVLTKGET